MRRSKNARRKGMTDPKASLPTREEMDRWRTRGDAEDPRRRLISLVDHFCMEIDMLARKGSVTLWDRSEALTALARSLLPLEKTKKMEDTDAG